MKSRGIRRALVWLLGTGVLVYLVRQASVLLDWEQVQAYWRLLPSSALVMLLALQTVTLLLSASLWFLPFRKTIGVSWHSFYQVFRIHSAAGLVESLTPSSKLGGETVKVALFRNLTRCTLAQLGPVYLMIKVVTILPLAFAVAILAVASPQFMDYRISAVFIAFAVLGLGFVGYRIRAKARSAKLHVDAVAAAVLLGLSTLMWSLYPVKFAIIAVSMGIDVPFWTVSAATFVAYGVSVLPLTPGGLGTFEGAMALVLSGSGVPWEAGLLIAGITRLFTFGFPLLVSAVMAVDLAISRRRGGTVATPAPQGGQSPRQ